MVVWGGGGGGGVCVVFFFFFFNDTATTEIYTLSLHDALPISGKMGLALGRAALHRGADVTLVAPLIHLEHSAGIGPDPMARLAALGGEDVTQRLRLSRSDQRRLESIRTQSVGIYAPKATGYVAGERAGLGAILLRFAMANTLLDAASVSAVKDGAAAVFPIKASDLPHLQGKALGDALAALKADWLASELTKTKRQLLSA